MFPPHTGLKRECEARMILGSCSLELSEGISLPYSIALPPIYVYLDEDKDLGGWKCSPMPTTKLEKNRAGGRLQGKYETFNETEDYDIVIISLDRRRI